MDQLALVLAADQDVAVGDLVTLVGADGGVRAGIEELAAAAGTIGYEVACGIRPRGEREVAGG
jgi:alanine racemase